MKFIKKHIISNCNIFTILVRKITTNYRISEPCTVNICLLIYFCEKTKKKKFARARESARRVWRATGGWGACASRLGGHSRHGVPVPDGFVRVLYAPRLFSGPRTARAPRTRWSARSACFPSSPCAECSRGGST